MATLTPSRRLDIHLPGMGDVGCSLDQYKGVALAFEVTLFVKSPIDTTAITKRYEMSALGFQWQVRES